MMLYDYNGAGRWSREAVLGRYEEYVRRFDVPAPRDLTPFEHTDVRGRRIYPVMFKVIDGIRAGDAACVELGVELIESDQRMPFGMILKSNAAKALRRASLTGGQQERVRGRVIRMLLAGHVPREYREYSKLLRKIGAGGRWPDVVEGVDLRDALQRLFSDAEVPLAPRAKQRSRTGSRRTSPTLAHHLRLTF